jgi:hypothetical protein
MSADSVEERLNNLEEKYDKKLAEYDKKVASLEHELERAKAVAEIQNLINRLQYLHGAGRDHELIDKVWAKAPDLRLHFGNTGYWEGWEAVKIVGDMGKDRKEAPPGAGMHIMLQPVIEVAKDGKTAQAVFWAMGIMPGKDRKTGEPSCSWEWNRYGDDFIKEDGKWKLWHHHVFDLFFIGYDEKWADQFKRPEMTGMHFPEEAQKYHHPPLPDDAPYDPNRPLAFLRPPEPYETWDPKQTYLMADPQKNP